MRVNLLALVIFFIMDIFSKLIADPITVDSISVVSNTRTQNFIILQELEFKKGASYSTVEFEEKVSNSVQNLKNLGIFGDVRINYEYVNTNYALKNESQAVSVEVTATDKWTFFPIPIYYYDSEIGSSLSLSIIEGNLAGLNQYLEVDYYYESIPNYQGFFIQFQYPRVFGSYIDTEISESYFQYNETEYNNNILVFESQHMVYSNYIRVGRRYPVSGSQWVVFSDVSILYTSDNVEINNAGVVLQDGLTFYPGIGLEEGIVNHDLGAIWGHFYRIKLSVSPLSGGIQTELRGDEYFRFWDKSGVAIRGVVRTSSLDYLFLTPDDIRGINLGQIRGNYLFYGNFEFRPYICTITWPAVLDFYAPFFIDAGEGILSNQGFGQGSSSITAGIGLRFYPKDFGSSGNVIRFDFGAILPSLLAGESFDKYFYFAFNFEDEFD
jgi:hypothetical protein